MTNFIDIIVSDNAAYNRVNDLLRSILRDRAGSISLSPIYTYDRDGLPVGTPDYWYCGVILSDLQLTAFYNNLIPSDAYYVVNDNAQFTRRRVRATNVNNINIDDNIDPDNARRLARALGIR